MILAAVLLSAAIGLGTSANDLPAEVPSLHLATASTCVTFGPNWGQMGRYFSAICFSGFGYYYARAHCYDDDGRYRTTVSGTIVPRVTGRFSEGYCPFGTHPWRRWVVLL